MVRILSNSEENFVIPAVDVTVEITLISSATMHCMHKREMKYFDFLKPGIQ